ncbi:YceI family protein [Aureisphaera galaxeae]|uniref:YceI family protein n=1 Tax=Aureisphaera galaxeae TaxID=1538023 RepID=UPI002350AE36|nr:YceI family protein [Aureisphaera galaxeae]MDC8004234.1 YceI family protein [Aureisphaera galaxeae]
MRTFVYFLFILLTSNLIGQTISIKESEAQVSFVFLDEDVQGSIEGFTFTGNIDLNALESSVISGSVITKTLDTNNWLRSRHLRSKKFFHAKEHPTLDFKSEQITGTNESFQVKGTLTIKGITQEVTWKFANGGNHLIGTTHINTHDFEIEVYKERERNEVDISITLPYSRQ